MNKSSVVPVNFQEGYRQPSRSLSAHNVKRILANAGVVLGIATGVGLAVEATNSTPPAPTPHIMTLDTGKVNPNLPVYKAEIEPGGTISGAVDTVAAAEGLKATDAIQERENDDSHAIAGMVSHVPGGDVPAGTTFEFQPVRPIVDEAKLNQNPTVIIEQVSSAQK